MKTARRQTPSEPAPLVVYVARSLDGTTFALESKSQQRIKKAFQKIRVSSRHVYISHDARETLRESVDRYHSPVLLLLTGVDPFTLGARFMAISFREPHQNYREIRHFPIKE